MPFIQTLDVDPVADEIGAAGMPALPELRGIIKNFSDGLGAFDQMYARMVGKGRLAPTLRLVILAAAARWRSDGYIAGAMFSQALQEGMGKDELATLIAEAEGSEPTGAEAVLLSFCQKITHEAYKTVQSDIDKLHSQDWSTGQIVEAVTMVSLSGYMTVLAASGGLLQNPNLEPEPWH